MKILQYLILFLFSINFCIAQETIEWDINYRLKLSDFKSSTSEINETLSTYSIHSGTQLYFSFHMSSYEFIFTKNFNSKVSTIFTKSAASIISPDSTKAFQLLKFGQYNFDLTELYARKFRKELYENKGAFSNVDFFKPIYVKLQTEMNEINARVLKESNLGENIELLEKEHKLVLTEIELLSDFCKECKPPKKKREKKNTK